MAFSGISDKVIKVWNAWDLRLSILMSFCLQALLMISAPLRKRKKEKWVSVIIWSAYLLADWIAAYAIGLICNSKFQSSKANKNDNLLMFWAPFLLLHLGGPDTITAFSLEDNELWLRHLFGLFFQFIVTAYTLLQSPPNNHLYIPTIIMFFSGIVKYGERSRALYLASMGKLGGYDGVKGLSLLDTSEGKEWLARVSIEDRQMTIIGIMQSAYLWFRLFKGVIIDHVFNVDERAKSRSFFLQRSAIEVFRILEIELNFIYDLLYTKASVIHYLVGYILHAICSCFILISFFLFLLLKKDGYNKIDIRITYTLFIGAITLDAISLFRLFISDWTIVALKNSSAKRIVSTILIKVPILKGARWSESLQQYNLISHCLNESPNLLYKMANCLGMNNLLVQIKFKSHVPVTDEMKQFIVSELKKKYEGTELQHQQIEDVISSRGDVVLKKNGWNDVEYSINDVEFDVSLLIWHLATEICYRLSEGPDGIDQKEQKSASDKQDFRQFSKLLSDYMMYLLIMQPTLMSAVAGFGKIKYDRTYDHIKRYFFHDGYWEVSPYDASCDFLETAEGFEEGYNIDPLQMQSFLTDGSILAGKLNRYENKWEIISKVWMEMLCYAASQCKSRDHVQQLSKGGELITFIWLLMTQLGLGKYFR